MGHDLRPYQQAALERLRARIRAGARRPILVAPTGSGKTTIAAEMIRSCLDKGKSALFVAHRKELIDQAYARLTDDFGLRAGVIMAADRRGNSKVRVQVGSVETLIRRRPIEPAPDLVILDECHRAVATSYKHVLQNYPSAISVGLTATPFRLDGRGLGEVFDAIEVLVSPNKLIEQGYLVPLEVWADVEPNLRGVHVRAGEYVSAELEGRVMTSLGDVAVAWENRATLPLLRPTTLAFAVTVTHSKALVDLLRARGHAAEHVDASTGKTEREAIWRRLRCGQTRIVSNVGIATEGFDCPAVECVLLARPTASLGLYLQMVGRGLRPCSGKSRAVVIDCGGNVMRHGWPTRDLSGEYTLDGVLPSADRKKKQGPSVRRCKRCFAVFEPKLGWCCPVCGWTHEAAFKTAATGVEVRKISEDETQRRMTTAVQWEYWQRLVAAQKRKRKQDGSLYAPGWSAAVFKGKFGFWPPRQWREAEGAR